MTGGAIDPDGLIARLRARAADPKRRTELDPGLAGSIRSFFSLDGNRPPRPVSPAELAAAERTLGLRLPPLLARVYTEVADGGFGPGLGLLRLRAVVGETVALRSGEPLPRNRRWPATLLPVVRMDPGWTCVDTVTGAMIDWDPEDLDERTSEARFAASFTERSPSLEAWLERWVTSKTAADRNKPSRAVREARMRARAQTPEAQARQHAKSRAAIERLPPEQRAMFGNLDDLFGPEPDPGARPDPKP